MSSMSNWWLVYVFGEDRSHGGNDGYDDSLRSEYKFTSNVSNHKQVHEGDFFIVCDKQVVVGVAKVKRLKVQLGLVEIRRCPVPGCGKSKMDERKQLLPRYVCRAGHEFNEPIFAREEGILYSAEFGDSFIEAPTPISKLDARSYCTTQVPQLSIRLVDPPLRNELLKRIGLRNLGND